MTINRFIPLYNTQSGAIPTASAMYDGELAVNIADGKLYTRFGNNIVALNDTSNFVSSSEQVTALIYNANISPNSVTVNELLVTGSAIIQNTLTVLGAISASSITGSFKGDGSQLTGIPTTLRISGSIGSDALDLLTDDLTVDGLNGILATVTDNTITIDVPVGLSASLYGTASVAEGIDVIFAGEYETGSEGYIIPIPSGGLSYITTASYAYTASYALYAANGGGGGGSGTSGTSGMNGAAGSSGTSGVSGATGTSGTSGINGVNGTSGTSGQTGTSGTSGQQGVSGTSGTSGQSGSSGSSGQSGTSGSSGLTGSSGTSGETGTSGTSGNPGTSGTSGISGVLPDGVVSSSQQVINYNIFAITGSNVFKDTQTITGSLYITSNLYVLGSSSISYVSQSTLDIGTNLVTVNVQNPEVRFGGLAVIDSGSSPKVSGSLLFDSVENQWLYIHQNQGVVTSSILIMGPETYNSVGSETHPTTNRIMKSINDEHIGDSQITDDGTTVSIPNNLTVAGTISGSRLIISGSERITGSLAITGSFTVNGQAVQALTSSYLYQLADVNDYVSGSIIDGYQLAWNSGSQQWTPTAGAAAKGTTRIFVSAQRSNTSAFYFNAIQLTSDSSSGPSQDTAFMLTSNLISKVNIYLRCDSNTTASLQLYRSLDGQTFGTVATASGAYPGGLTGSLAANTVRQFTFSNLTFNNYDTLHIFCKPTANGYFYGIVTIE